MLHVSYTISCCFKHTKYITIIYLLLILIIDKLDETTAFNKFRNGHRSIGEPSKGEWSAAGDDGLEGKENWFAQKLDHFDKTESNVLWKQLYYTNDAFYRRNDSNSPIFLTIGGELAITPRGVTTGAWIRYAQHFGAMCFHLEHRFYGKSRPKSDLSYDNLRYLTSRQALEDVANFIRGMNIKYDSNEKRKWIVFGGSYPGALAAWAREKYPQLIYGAISSSAPLLAKVDFYEYLQVVKASLKTHSKKCLNSVGSGFAEIETLLRHEIGQRDLDKKFKTCTPIRDSIQRPLDLSNFFQILADNIAGVVQYNNDNRPNAGPSIADFCNVMVNTTIGPPVARLGIVSGMLLEQAKEDCFDYKYDKMLTEMRNISWDSKEANGTRQWTYQTCNEFGYYQTSNNKSDTFGDRFKVDFFIKQCMDIYSKSMNAKYLEQVVSETNKFYGDLNPQTTNVLYIHGSIDPWHALGLTSSKNPKLPTIFIEGTAHCSDLYEPAETDSPQLVAAREKIQKFIEQLLNERPM